MPYVDGLKLTRKERELQKKLLEEEDRLRSKQPLRWTRRKYGVYAEYLSRRDKLLSSSGQSELTAAQLRKIKKQARVKVLGRMKSRK